MKYSNLNKKLYNDLSSVRYHLLHCNINIPELQNSEAFGKLSVKDLYEISAIAEKEIRSERYRRSIDFANIALTIAQVNGNKDIELENFIPWSDRKEDDSNDSLLNDVENAVNDSYPIDSSALSVLYCATEKGICPSWVINSLNYQTVKDGRCTLERSPYRFLVSKYACLIDTYKGDKISPLICFNINWIHNFPSQFDVFDPLTSKKVGTIKTLEEWLNFLSVADSELEWL